MGNITNHTLEYLSRKTKYVDRRCYFCCKKLDWNEINDFCEDSVCGELTKFGKIRQEHLKSNSLSNKTLKKRSTKKCCHRKKCIKKYKNSIDD
jgi:hypothetical protein